MTPSGSGRPELDADELIRRERFAHQVRAQLDALRADPEAWADYLAEGDATAVADGIGD